MRRIIQVKLGLGLRSSGSLTSIKEVISEVQWKGDILGLIKPIEEVIALEARNQEFYFIKRLTPPSSAHTLRNAA